MESMIGMLPSAPQQHEMLGIDSDSDSDSSVQSI